MWVKVSFSNSFSRRCLRRHIDPRVEYSILDLDVTGFNPTCGEILHHIPSSCVITSTAEIQGKSYSLSYLQCVFNLLDFTGSFECFSHILNLCLHIVLTRILYFLDEVVGVKEGSKCATVLESGL